MAPKTLRQRIEELYAGGESFGDRRSALRTFNEFKFFLNNGSIRAARLAAALESLLTARLTRRSGSSTRTPIR
jgi:hypothetical protein